MITGVENITVEDGIAGDPVIIAGIATAAIIAGSGFHPEFQGKTSSHIRRNMRVNRYLDPINIVDSMPIKAKRVVGTLRFDQDALQPQRAEGIAGYPGGVSRVSAAARAQGPIVTQTRTIRCDLSTPFIKPPQPQRIPVHCIGYCRYTEVGAIPDHVRYSHLIQRPIEI